MLKDSGFSAAALKDSGLTGCQLLKGGLLADELKGIGFTTATLMDASGISEIELLRLLAASHSSDGRSLEETVGKICDGSLTPEELLLLENCTLL